MPPVSKVTPLPESHGFCFGAGALPAHHHHAAFPRAALADAQQSAHAKFRHLGFIQHLDLDAQLSQGFALLRHAVGIQHVRGLAHQIAGHEDAIGDRAQRLEMAAGSSGALRQHRDGSHARLVQSFQFCPVFIKTIARQAGAIGHAGRGHGRIDLRAWNGVAGNGHGFQATIGQTL